jgi:hypothetical protein
MKSTAVIDTSEVDALFKRIDKQFSKDIVKALNVTAMKGVNMILDRTEKGKGYESRFARYTPEYAKRKAEGWPRAKNRPAFSGDPSGNVNLQVTGKMLSSMTTRLDKPKLTAEIAFTRANESKKAYYNNQKRPFFGFNQREQRYLRRFFYGVFLR